MHKRARFSVTDIHNPTNHYSQRFHFVEWLERHFFKVGVAHKQLPIFALTTRLWRAAITTLSALHYTYVGLNMIQEEPGGGDAPPG